MAHGREMLSQVSSRRQSSSIVVSRHHAVVSRHQSSSVVITPSSVVLRPHRGGDEARAWYAGGRRTCNIKAYQEGAARFLKASAITASPDERPFYLLWAARSYYAAARCAKSGAERRSSRPAMYEKAAKVLSGLGPAHVYAVLCCYVHAAVNARSDDRTAAWSRAAAALRACARVPDTEKGEALRLIGRAVEGSEAEACKLAELFDVHGIDWQSDTLGRG